MPKAKIATETTEVIKQAQAAANDEPVLTPSENAAIQELTQPTLDAIDNQTETPPDEDLQHIQAFEDAMAEAYYDKNPEIYEAAFGLYELAPAQSASITRTFHEEYQKNYADCLDELFDTAIAGLL